MGVGGNCEMDNDKLLFTLQSLCKNRMKGETTQTTVTEGLSVGNSSTSNPVISVPNLPTKCAIEYVSGYIIHRVFKEHKCESCWEKLSKTGSLCDVESIFIHLKSLGEGDFGKLIVPSALLVAFIQSLDNHFSKTVRASMHCNGVMKSILHSYSTSNSDLHKHLCSGIADFITNLFLRMRLYSDLPKLLTEITTKPDKSCKNAKFKKLKKLKHI